MENTTTDRFEEDSAILKGLNARAQDLGYTTVTEALNSVAFLDSEEIC